MTKQCLEVLGASYNTGAVLCMLPEGHEGDHDGGAAERQIGEEVAAQMLDNRMEYDD